jgi:hypothetical protein
MPLHHWLDRRLPWRSFHRHWIIRIAEHLNQGVLPATPLFLRGDKLFVEVDLEVTYQATLQAGRYEPA